MRPCALALCFDESNLRSPRDESMSSLARLVLDIEAQLVGRAVQTPRRWRPAMHQSLVDKRQLATIYALH